MDKHFEEDKDDNLFEEERFKTPDFAQHKNKPESVERAPVVIPEPLTDSNPPEGVFTIEIIKNGSVIQRKPICKNRLIFGRLKEVDIPMEHPSISRNHACLLWNPNDGEDGSFFLVDLNSVHGTFVNKKQIQPSKPHKISTGNDLIKIGGSTRLFFLNSSKQAAEENEKDSDYFKSEEEATKSGDEDEDDKGEDVGCTWGINDDIDEDDSHNDYLTPLGQILSLLQTGVGPEKTPHEDSYINDPQKSLRTWFDQEGYDFEFKIDCIHNKFKCNIDVPIDGQNVNFEGETRLKRKEAIQDACLKVCRILDKAELLYAYQKRREARKKRENESDSEGDMIDETDQYKLKKAKRQALQEGMKVKIENYETLNQKWKELSTEIAALRAKLAQMSVQNRKIPIKIDRAQTNPAEEETEADPLDSYMADIKKSEASSSKTPLELKIQKSKLKNQIFSLEMQQRKVERMLEIAKPKTKA